MIETGRLRAGDWVEVASEQEILQTLDEKGQLDGLPFMPEMLQYCGGRFRVYKRAHKTCDTVFPVRGRRMKAGILLALRCDGLAHGGCQAGCLIFWKEAWLKPVTDGSSLDSTRVDRAGVGCKHEDLWRGTRRMPEPGTDEPVYICQATQLPQATAALEWWDVQQYVEDYVSGNVRLSSMVSGFIHSIYEMVVNAGIGLGAALRWVYDITARLRQGGPYPRRHGTIPVGMPTPMATLNLQPGEMVQVRPYRDILATCNTEDKNHGLMFDAEMVPFCGRSFRVLRRVERIINEKTGRMLKISNPCIILEGVVCEARYSACRLFCPRSIYSYWREAWLKRVMPSGSAIESGRTVEMR